ncbi:MAG: cobalt-precorrin-5B (C(1))-methyltransferase [Deltaproteobacteria bacterium]|nr:cobalt-precorrin-5B (C(1))-methyltransferase [Deltaproteobacteria bacterium]
MESLDKKGLRKGWTTGACAAAGAKAAAQALFSRHGKKKRRRTNLLISLSLPTGNGALIRVKEVDLGEGIAIALVIKDAGSDPDVTNRAQIVTEVRLNPTRLGQKRARINIKGGKGVGMVTKPGLSVPVGRPAINPVPLKMIRRGVMEAAGEAGITPSVTVTVSVPDGERLALKTMNPRLGILGGISILGTTGIVEPMSLSAYTHSISSAINVALASGLEEVVFSTGRTSEKAVERFLKLPEEAFIITGDHMGYALDDASGRKGLKRIYIAGQFGKFTKLAAGHFETHCADSSVELETIAHVCQGLNISDAVLTAVIGANTARQAFFILKDAGLKIALNSIAKKVRDNAKALAKGISVKAVLVDYDGGVITTV